MVSRPREWVRESVTQGEGISTPHVRRTRRDPRPRIKKRLLNITHTHGERRWGSRGTSSIRYRTLCLHILSGTRIRATVVRLTHAKQHKTYKQARVANMEPDSQSLGLRRHPNQNTLKRANVEPDSQSLGLRQHPNPNTQSDNKQTHAKKKKVARSGLARPPAYIPCLEQGSGRCSSPERD